MNIELYEFIADRLMASGSFSFKGYRYYLGLDFEGNWEVYKAPLFKDGGYDTSQAEMIFQFSTI